MNILIWHCILMPHTLLKYSNTFYFLKVVERLQLHVLAQEHPTVDPVREIFCELIVDVSRCWYSKDIVKFLESTLLGFCGNGVG